MKQAATVVTPTMIGMSTSWIACQVELADARPAEHQFDDHRPAHEDADVEPDHGDDRQGGVAQGVDQQDHAAGPAPLARAVTM